jgi:hypothetical protein
LFLKRFSLEGTVPAKVLSSRKRTEKEDRKTLKTGQEKASSSKNKLYPFRIKSAPGGNQTSDLALVRQMRYRPS